MGGEDHRLRGVGDFLELIHENGALGLQSLDDIPASLVRELTYFFENYKRAEGKATSVERWDDADEAKRIIEWAREYYREHEE